MLIPPLLLNLDDAYARGGGRYRWYEVKTPELELANWNLELRSRSSTHFFGMAPYVIFIL